MPEQIHGGTIVKAQDLARGRLAADGVLVSTPGTLVAIGTADCAPTVITTAEHALVLHVSRKTLIRGLLDNALTYVAPADISRVYVGPHICEYHFGFEEEGELLKRFRYRYPAAVHFHKGVEYLSLRKALRGILAEWGVDTHRVIEDGRCTFEHPTLPSYRRHRAAGLVEPPQGLRTVVWRPAASERKA
jgi:copper oxidase (laccase) domain-containing protein